MLLHAPISGSLPMAESSQPSSISSAEKSDHGMAVSSILSNDVVGSSRRVELEQPKTLLLDTSLLEAPSTPGVSGGTDSEEDKDIMTSEKILLATFDVGVKVNEVNRQDTLVAAVEHVRPGEEEGMRVEATINNTINTAVGHAPTEMPLATGSTNPQEAHSDVGSTRDEAGSFSGGGKEKREVAPCPAGPRSTSVGDAMGSSGSSQRVGGSSGEEQQQQRMPEVLGLLPDMIGLHAAELALVSLYEVHDKFFSSDKDEKTVSNIGTLLNGSQALAFVPEG